MVFIDLQCCSIINRSIRSSSSNVNQRFLFKATLHINNSTCRTHKTVILRDGDYISIRDLSGVKILVVQFPIETIPVGYTLSYVPDFYETQNTYRMISNPVYYTSIISIENKVQRKKNDGKIHRAVTLLLNN